MSFWLITYSGNELLLPSISISFSISFDPVYKAALSKTVTSVLQYFSRLDECVDTNTVQ